MQFASNLFYFTYLPMQLASDILFYYPLSPGQINTYITYSVAFNITLPLFPLSGFTINSELPYILHLSSYGVSQHPFIHAMSFFKRTLNSIFRSGYLLFQSPQSSVPSSLTLSLFLSLSLSPFIFFLSPGLAEPQHPVLLLRAGVVGPGHAKPTFVDGGVGAPV